MPEQWDVSIELIFLTTSSTSSLGMGSIKLCPMMYGVWAKDMTFQQKPTREAARPFQVTSKQK
ncbi:MAG: hypothetical protein Gyms2KO_18250 [Gymnodinialimonas sp.]